MLKRLGLMKKEDAIRFPSEESYPKPPMEYRPMIKDLLRIGSQFIGYREYAARAEEKLSEANERVDALAQKLEQSEAARKKAELAASKAKAEVDEAKVKAASVEELQRRLKDAESALDEQKTAQTVREQEIIKRLKSQSRPQTNQDFDLENPVNDPLLDALSPGVPWREIREGVANAENMKVAVESTVALVADSQQTLDWMKVGDTSQVEHSRWRLLIKAAKPNTKKILAYLGIKPASTPSSSRPEV
ncbi:hypothetical protein QYE76_006493 [Lolium multiflorum]|uniref:Uncharacterized protein n=1 Tax=Lolium multiflorum TaxID=4521 RepID=A0AAD8W451_LOLMU|nr:hypothetical protein QYE76_006493 [Lolium multiflorum]